MCGDWRGCATGTRKAARLMSLPPGQKSQTSLKIIPECDCACCWRAFPQYGDAYPITRWGRPSSILLASFVRHLPARAGGKGFHTMASLVLGIAGSAIGPSLFGAGFSLFGASITGAEIGGAIGTLVGTELDNLLAPGTHITRKSPRLTDVNIQASAEGAPIPRVCGRMRVAGQLLWATKFKETVIKSQQQGGGKGGPPVTETEIDYKYSISFAVGLCAGVVTKIGRVWADGNLIDIAQFTTRFYPGDEAQVFDPLIEETEGAGNTPAYRGLATIVFEDMDLTNFGNRIPQLNFEIIRSLSAGNPDALENRLAGVALIPGAGEFVYATEVVTADNGQGTTTPQNAHNASGVPDYTASLDELQALAPNASAVALVVGWFGDD